MSWLEDLTSRIMSWMRLLHELYCPQKSINLEVTQYYSFDRKKLTMPMPFYIKIPPSDPSNHLHAIKVSSHCAAWLPREQHWSNRLWAGLSLIFQLSVPSLESSLRGDKSTSVITQEECHILRPRHARISSARAASAWRTSAPLWTPSVGHQTPSSRWKQEINFGNINIFLFLVEHCEWSEWWGNYFYIIFNQNYRFMS